MLIIVLKFIKLIQFISGMYFIRIYIKIINIKLDVFKFFFMFLYWIDFII